MHTVFHDTSLLFSVYYINFAFYSLHDTTVYHNATKMLIRFWVFGAIKNHCNLNVATDCLARRRHAVIFMTLTTSAFKTPPTDSPILNTVGCMRL